MAHNQTVLITGASKGIGLSLTEIFAQEHYNLILVARNQSELARIAEEIHSHHGNSVQIIATDLSEPNAAQNIFDQLEKQNIFVDILINNAGFANYGLFHENDFQSERQMLQVNVNALMEMTHLFSKPMVARRQGKILNVASTAAFLPGPLMANYYASKAYVLSFSEALANELKKFDVQVSVLCPGPTKTHFTERAKMEKSKLFQNGAMTSNEVAKAAYKGLLKGQTLIIPGLQNNLIARLPRLFPLSLAASITRQAQEKNAQ